jgi:hypothetical protein
VEAAEARSIEIELVQNNIWSNVCVTFGLSPNANGNPTTRRRATTTQHNWRFFVNKEDGGSKWPMCPRRIDRV